ncbi:ABC transporter permease [Dehalobacter sp. DCM]|uniref:ABC transporter permease n=1 Tax=Dehalobacter sp. DCM TaxID=2907827 RepID=UPI00308210C8|nr:ABC transporter permease [Dehalobacter sp. DCM]
MKQFSKKIDPVGLIFPLLLLSIWYFVAASGKIPSYLLPSPEKFFQVMMDFIFGSYKLTPYSGKMVENMLASCLRVLCGFSLAALVGLLLGFLTGRIRLIKRIIDPSVHMVRTIPGIGWLPMAMVWFGIGERTTVFLIALAAFFPIYINAAHGAGEVPLLLIRAGRMLGASKSALFTTVILPSAFPSVVVGLRLGLGVSWAYLVLGELTGVSKGLGAVMMDARMLGQVEMIPAAMIWIAILGRLSDLLLIKLCQKIYPYYGGGRN